MNHIETSLYWSNLLELKWGLWLWNKVAWRMPWITKRSQMKWASEMILLLLNNKYIHLFSISGNLDFWMDSFVGNIFFISFKWDLLIHVTCYLYIYYHGLSLIIQYFLNLFFLMKNQVIKKCDIFVTGKYLKTVTAHCKRRRVYWLIMHASITEKGQVLIHLM